MTQKAKRSFTLVLPAELVEKLDIQAKSLYSTRTEYIKDAIVARLRREDALNELSSPNHDMCRHQLRQYVRRTFVKGYFTEDKT